MGSFAVELVGLAQGRSDVPLLEPGADQDIDRHQQSELKLAPGHDRPDPERGDAGQVHGVAAVAVRAPETELRAAGRLASHPAQDAADSDDFHVIEQDRAGKDQPEGAHEQERENPVKGAFGPPGG